MEYMRHKHRADGLIELHRRHIEEKQTWSQELYTIDIDTKAFHSFQFSIFQSSRFVPVSFQSMCVCRCITSLLDVARRPLKIYDAKRVAHARSRDVSLRVFFSQILSRVSWGFAEDDYSQMSIEYVLSCMICKKATGAPEPEVEMYIYCHPYQVSCHCKGSPPNVMHDINKCLCLCGSSSRLVRRERP